MMKKKRNVSRYTSTLKRSAAEMTAGLRNSDGFMPEIGISNAI
jgi:hypothetical protein